MYIEEMLLRELLNKSFCQKDIALTYRLAIGVHTEINWKKINEAIIKRCSISGLLRVIELALKL